jgi:predicted dehydrogenase
MTLRIGIIGCGEHSDIGHGVPLRRYAAEHPGTLSLVAACDLRRERAELFREKHGFRQVYLSLDDMLSRERLDACISVVPVERIAGVAMTLLERKIACVVEKPLGSTIAEVEKLAEVARLTRTPNMVSVNRRFMPLLIRGMEWARSTGRLRYVRATMLRHNRTEREFLRFTAIHALDTVRFIAGDFAASTVQVLQGAVPSYAIDLGFENGARGRIDVLPASGLLEETYEMMGDGFRVIVTSPFGPQRLLRCYREDRLVLEELAGPETPEDITFGFYGEVEEFIQAIRNGRNPRPSIEEIVPSVRACFELGLQAEGGTWQTSSRS